MRDIFCYIYKYLCFIAMPGVLITMHKLCTQF